MMPVKEVNFNFHANNMQHFLSVVEKQVNTVFTLVRLYKLLVMINSFIVGWLFGAPVKPQLGMPASHSGEPEFGSQLHY